MHLTRVELENFKSFGRRVEVPFLEGFTAVTGPNGSGKSNIADAILFVLGPRSSKAIRAGRLTDLIYNGGKSRKPADYCRVSLTFDNRDRTVPLEEDEVTLTRLVRRSRSHKDDAYSHYYVNGRASSQGEFENLLAHARISADGYNLVQQGDVTRIVTMTPLERRRLLDDIAGITRFDEDIERAERKRADVEQNLDRIRIILGEIEHQLKALARDREAAQRFKDLKGQVEEARARLAWRRARDAREELARVAREEARAQEERAAAERDLAALRGKADEAERSLREAEERIAGLGGEDAKAMRAQIEGLRLAAQLAKEAINHAKGEVQELKEARARDTAELARVEKERRGLEKERAALEAQRARQAERLANQQKALEDVRDAVSKSTSAAGDLHRELAQLKVEHEKAAAQLHGLRLERDRLMERRERLKSAVAEGEELLRTTEFEVKDLAFQIKEARKETEGSTRSAQEARKELLARRKEEAELIRQLQELEAAIRRLRHEYSQLKAEADAAQAVQRGYTRAVAAVLEARDTGRLKGICGTIAELGKVEPRHEVAMEIAAGGRMQAIVTEDDEAAARAIAFLKEHRLGRATFLPLNKMAPGRPAGKALLAVKDSDAVGFAIDLIRHEERYRNAFWYVFRDTVLVETLDAARRLMGGVRLVTLGGDLIDAGGAMTGGEEPQPGLRFGGPERGHVERLGKELRQAVQQQEKLSAQLLDLRAAIAALEDEIKTAGIEGAGREARLGELERKEKEYGARLKSQEDALAAARKELEEAEAALAKLGGQVERLEARLRELDEARDGKSRLLLKATKKELAAELEALQAETLGLSEQVRDADARLGALAKQLEIVAQRAAELEARARRADEAIAAHQAAIEAKKAEAEAKEQELRVLLKVEEERGSELKGLQEARDKAYEDRVALQAKIEKLADRIDSLGDLLVALEGKKPSLEQEAREAEEELAQSPAKVEGEVGESLDELKQRLRRLEQQIEGLGGVNFRALEEYEEQARRKQELEAEVGRLNEQREELLRLVEEIGARKKEGLLKVFGEIDQNFRRIFARLTDGGTAELRLENPERPFEAGLLIRAQPKGKKITRLESLSGGEKSLTALALVFAIQEYAPSPFYVLDEIDMFLDGVNAEKVALMVKSNSRKAQFIVVSLRKVTLKEADHVYGVTMTPDGQTEIVGEVRIDEIVEAPPPPPPPELLAAPAGPASPSP